MAWTAEHRRAADRRGLRYPSDLTDAEWALVAPLIRPAKHGGRPRKVDVREVLNAVFYVLSTGCQWSALPKDLPPKSKRQPVPAVGALGVKFSGRSSLRRSMVWPRARRSSTAAM